MLKKYKLILVAIAVIIIAFAMKSWGALGNYRELNELAIVSSIGIDKEDDGNYLVSVQIMNTKKESSGAQNTEGSSQVVVYKQSAKTISLALQNIIKELPKKLYTAHMSLLVVNEKLAREDGLSVILDYFYRDVESSKEFVTLIARNTSAENILKTLTPINNNPAKDLVDSYATMLSYQGNTTNSIASNLMELYLETGKNVLCASVVLNGDESAASSQENTESSEPPALAEISDIAYFKDGKLKGYLDGFDNVAYNFFNDNITSTVLELQYKGSPLAFEVFKSSTNYNVVEDNGQFSINYNIKIRGNIKEIDNSELSETDGNIATMQDEISNQLKEKLENYINNIKNTYDTDIMGVQSLAYEFQNKAYEKVKDNFNFKDVKINVSVSTEIASEGGLLKKW